MQALALIALAAGVACALLVAVDLPRRLPQRMWIMNVVWPITALYAGPLGLWFYAAVGRRPPKRARRREGGAGERPFWQTAALAATHCGAGCTLGDIAAESFLIAVPLTFLGHEIFAAWALDFVCAFAIGIAFQYFTIAPMRGLSFGEGLVAALKADTLSLTAWQVGMYGWMAIVRFLVYRHPLEKTSPTFWFMMQLAMLVGFATALPVNWWLVKAGLKEKMG